MQIVSLGNNWHEMQSLFSEKEKKKKRKKKKKKKKKTI